MTIWKCDQCDKTLTEDDIKYFTADGCWCEECWLKEDEKNYDDTTTHEV